MYVEIHNSKRYFVLTWLLLAATNMYGHVYAIVGHYSSHKQVGRVNVIPTPRKQTITHTDNMSRTQIVKGSICIHRTPHL